MGDAGFPSAARVVLLCQPVAKSHDRHARNWLLHRDGKRYVADVIQRHGVVLETKEMFAAMSGCVRAVARVGEFCYRSHLGD